MPIKVLSKLLNPPEEPYVRPSLVQNGSNESIASDATAPNNPGPGRNLGRLYDALGSRFEHILNRTIGSRHPPVHLSLQLARTDSADSVATDATAPNNPGPGRNVGRLFDAIGARIEGMLNRRAGRLKLGPDAVALQIRQLCHYRDLRRAEPGQPKSTDEEYLAMKKLCRKLLKYCRSPTLATQLRALEEVAALAIEDPHVRGVLASILNNSYLVPKYNETELRISSVKAVISIKENAVHDLWSRYDSLIGYLNTVPSGDHLILRRLQDEIEHYVNDPDISFLVGRLLKNDTQTRSLFVEPAWIRYLEAAIKRPQIIEWSTLFILFNGSREMETFVRDNGFYIMQLSPYIQDFALYEPLRAPRCNDLIDSVLDLSHLEKHSHTICQFLDAWFVSRHGHSPDLSEQLRWLRYEDSYTLNSLRNTVLGNEILFVYTRIYHETECPTCSPSSIRFMFQTTCGMDTYFPDAKVLLCYWLFGSHDEQALARIIIIRAIKLNRYFKYAIGSLLAQYGKTEYLPNLASESFSRDSAANHTHPVRDGEMISSLNLKRQLINVDHPPFDEESAYLHQIDSFRLHCSSDSCLWLQVHGDKRPFNATGHFPILAGYDRQGNELYVARQGLFSYDYTCVTDGACSVWSYHETPKALPHFAVLVLRGDPCDVDAQEIPKGAKLQTGPVYWLQDDNVSDGDSDLEIQTVKKRDDHR